MQIGHSVNLCCPGDYENYYSYGVELQNMPGFLSSYIVEEFDTAFQEKGMVRNDRLNDLVVTLRYEHVNLNPEQEGIDPFERRVVEQEELDPFERRGEQDMRLRYAATVFIDMHEAETGTHVWGGQINRIHSVLPGEYMHEERSRPAFLAAFTAVLDSYPPRPDAEF